MPWSKQGGGQGDGGGPAGGGDGGDASRGAPPPQPAAGGPAGSPWGAPGGSSGNPWGRPGAPGADGPGPRPAGSDAGGGKPPPTSPGHGGDAWRRLGDRLGAVLGGGGSGDGSGGGKPPGGGTGGAGFGGPNTGRYVALGVAALLLVWGASGVYRVGPDEQGVVLRFGRWQRTEAPGLHVHLPSPIESVLLPKVTRVNRIEIGYRSGSGRADRDVADESTMLTGDENIVDIDFAVFWVIKDAGKFLFEIREPEETVKKAAESAMREIIGRTEIQPALTDARQQIETSTLQLLQTMLDQYDAGIEVTQVQLQRVEPPAAVVEAFNDVQRARQDRERLRNEAESYRNDVLPRARGDAQRLLQEAEAYRAKTVDGAQGDAQRFISVLDAYSQAPDAASRRLYIESMEETLRGVRKIIIDPKAGAQGVQSYLPLSEVLPKPPAQAGK